MINIEEKHVKLQRSLMKKENFWTFQMERSGLRHLKLKRKGASKMISSTLAYDYFSEIPINIQGTI